MTDAEIMSNVMHQIRVNEVAICMLATKAGADPEALFNHASDIVDQMIEEGKFNAASLSATASSTRPPIVIGGTPKA